MVFILLLISNCEESKDKCWDIGKPCGNLFFYFNIIKPREDRENSCRQPNAINTCPTSNSCGCTSNKIATGAIFDNSLKVYITTETISSPKELLCLCPNQVVPRISQWSKGKELNQETFPPNVLRDFITTDAKLDKSILPIGTNLFCLFQCKIDEEYKYQVLKLRSNP